MMKWWDSWCAATAILIRWWRTICPCHIIIPSRIICAFTNRPTNQPTDATDGPRDSSFLKEPKPLIKSQNRNFWKWRTENVSVDFWQRKRCLFWLYSNADVQVQGILNWVEILKVRTSDSIVLLQEGMRERGKWTRLLSSERIDYGMK